ncbi:glutamate--cysteine ligase [Anabaena sp. FACHB-1237]|uniref:glutamate--cysteine ligase n=1 Tax=Anabaena sp. FACHB-1237 TaxID=2692769 RepID=UPI0016800EDA|nr:glutamate--cysteine ligase [Anabaena sp. FACHB-1237]MBD2136971.1 glutamate--cysteine ligase [Anabaena sp. FACHB-1237]
MFSFGIEHEVAFLNRQGKFADFSCTNFSDFQQIVDKLPLYTDDHLQLRIGDAGIKKKRWYIEGFERFSPTEKFITCIPKGIEIRTTIHPTIQGVIDELTTSFHLLREMAVNFGFSPVLVSFNPYNCLFTPEPPLNDFEIKQLQNYPDEQTAHIYMVSYGPDLNISLANLPIEKVIDIGQKLTYYSPYIVPFSYSSPFYNGVLWNGLSVRTFIRTGKRSATLVFVEKPEQIIKSVPSLTKVGRIPAEIGRIEFKACDSCDDFLIYAGLLTLLKGLALDNSLSGRAIIPDANLHQISAKFGFGDPEILDNAAKILEVVENVLVNDPDIKFLVPLKMILANRKTKADYLIEMFQHLGSIEETLKTTYSGF